MKSLKGLLTKVANVAKATFRFIVRVLVAPVKYVKGLFNKESDVESDAAAPTEFVPFDAKAKAQLEKAVRKFTTKHNVDASMFNYSVYANKHGYNLAEIQVVMFL